MCHDTHNESENKTISSISSIATTLTAYTSNKSSNSVVLTYVSDVIDDDNNAAITVDYIPSNVKNFQLLCLNYY